MRTLLLIMLGLMSVACTTTPQRLEPAPAFVEPYDPFEKHNRRALRASAVIDDLYIKPAADIYRWVLPQPVRTAAANFTSNILTPSWIFNEILQLDFEDAGHTTLRFAINSTVGVGGLFDPATKWGFEARPEDLSQTLGNWGVPAGPYFIAPGVGPTNARGVMGSLARIGLSPTTQLILPDSMAVRGALVAQRTAQKRIEGDTTLERVYTQEDGYIILRSLYLQEQAAQLHEDAEDPYENLPDF